MIKSILIIGTLVIAILGSIFTDGDKIDKGFGFICGGLLGFAITGLIVLILLFTTSKTSINEYIKGINTEKLISMKFDKNIEGNFYLGTGSINNEEYVIFYTKQGNELVRHKYKANDIKILTDTNNPSVEITTKDKSVKIGTIFGELNETHENIYKLIFHIPEKSIIENIKLN